MSDYARIMMEEQAKARTAYNFDPREMYTRASRNFSTIETFNSTRPNGGTAVNEEDYTDVPTGSRADSNVVQDTPKTRAVKRYVIIDGSQRDWVRQPNPYSNLVYSFGSQTTAALNPPVYTNNTFVPTFALEQSLLPAPIPGIPNNQGWTLPAGLGGTTTDISYLPYNSSLTRGNFIAYDTGYTIQPSGAGFGSVFTPSNVASIRLVRAVLPQRQFLSIPIDPGTNPTDASTSQFIQSNLIGKPYSTFTTYPYLLFYLNEFFGQYIGGNEPMRRSFSVMTQKQRQQTNFQTDLGVQQYDYEAWGEEALRFQSPVTNLQRLAVTITDPIGASFVQNDSLTTALIQATSNGLYLQCFTPGLQAFSSNEMRVGDRVVFYPETLSNIIKSPILAVLNSQKTDFVKSLQNTTFPILQLLDYVTDSNGLYVPRSDVSGAERKTAYVSSYNGFLIPNFITIQNNGQVAPLYPQAVDPLTNTILEVDVLVGSNMPLLNTSLQPVYTLELETLEPDTGSIGGRIVL